MPGPIRVLSDLRHGGHALSEDLYKADPMAKSLEGVSPVDDVLGQPQPPDITTISTPFGYMFVNLRDAYPAAHLPQEPPSTVVTALKALGTAMAEPAPADPASNSTIPPVYTYLGQFVDHDLTANTDRDSDIGIIDNALTPLPPDEVVSALHNLRQPALNLDSLYGNGPHAPNMAEEVPYTGIKFDIGPLASVPPQFGSPVPGADLPRFAAPHVKAQKARIGDGRNDENLIVAQLHVGFLKFHNAVVDWVRINDPQADDDATFERAKQLVQWHYQTAVVNDFLKTIAKPTVVDAVLAGQDLIFAPTAQNVFMPLEFSVAAFRFGHSMVRSGYDHNENFGEPNGNPNNQRGFATFDELFEFTGNGGLRGLPTLPSNWPIRWERFTNPAPSSPARFARKIDTNLAPPLFDLRNEGRDPALPRRIQRIVQRLAVRNLLRGYRLAIPTGQNIAAEIAVAPLTTAQLLSGRPAVRDALIDGGFVEDTPLWFYVLKEAEIQEQGNRLGDVGGRIVAETIIGQLRADESSFLNRQGGAWTPAEGVKLPDGSEVATIRDLLRFAGVHP